MGAMGAAPSVVQRLRAAAAICTGLGGPGKCSTTAIALELGEHRDPGHQSTGYPSLANHGAQAQGHP
eukprot:6059329-Lingulodinium_polyedra.AAC.1